MTCARAENTLSGPFPRKKCWEYSSNLISLEFSLIMATIPAYCISFERGTKLWKCGLFSILDHDDRQLRGYYEHQLKLKERLSSDDLYENGTRRIVFSGKVERQLSLRAVSAISDARRNPCRQNAKVQRHIIHRMARSPRQERPRMRRRPKSSRGKALPPAADTDP